MNSDAHINRFDDLSIRDDSNRIQDTIRLLQLIEKDYQGTRKQLENIGRTLAERETLVSQRIHNARMSSENTSCMCLLSYQSSTMGNKLGSAVLRISDPEFDLPKLKRLEINCLDGFQVSSGGIKVERWDSIKAKSLLQYLLAKPRKAVAKEMLMEALWPGCEPRVSSNNLKSAMHGLRQTFNSLFNDEQSFPYVVFIQGAYQINPEIVLWIDVEQFELHWEKGRRLLIQGENDEAMREFKLAEELYKADYLADEPYEEWTLLRRESLQDTYLNILGKLAESCIQDADYESCINYCLKILDKDTCREDAYHMMMRCYSRSGLKSRAIRWYEICRRTLESELDTAPTPETTRLYQQILNNEPV